MKVRGVRGMRYCHGGECVLGMKGVLLTSTAFTVYMSSHAVSFGGCAGVGNTRFESKLLKRGPCHHVQFCRCNLIIFLTGLDQREVNI